METNRHRLILGRLVYAIAAPLRRHLLACSACASGYLVLDAGRFCPDGVDLARLAGVLMSDREAEAREAFAASCWPDGTAR